MESANCRRSSAGIGPASLLSGFGAGLTVVVIGGFFWSLAQMMTGMALTWVPMLSMGCIVGIAVGKGGRGSNYRFGLLGMALAVLGCFTGDFFRGAPRSSVSWAACPASRSIPSAFGSSSATKHIGRTP